MEKRWSESEAREVLEEFSRSGETQTSFCQRRGIGYQRLRYWRQRLATRGPAPAFVPVELPSATKIATAREITIRVGDIAVCVREGLDVEYLARLVEALGRQTRAC